MTVAEMLRRNRKITITTRNTVSSSVNWTSVTEAWIASAREYRFVMLTEAGSSERKVGRIRLIALTTSTVLVPGCRWIASTTARWLSPQPAPFLQPPGRPVVIGHDDWPVRGGVGELAVGLHGERLVRAVERAGGQVDVRVLDRQGDLSYPTT